MVRWLALLAAAAEEEISVDTFDLKWPKTQATFYTDGWRCRIVWREQGGPGGTIDNHGLCKRRLADSLDGAPYLLSALRARGYGNLAQEIEGLLEIQPQGSGREDAPVGPAVPEAAPPRAAAAKQAPTAAELPANRNQVSSWIAGLEGDATFAETGPRRAKSWSELGHLGEEQLALKAPAPKGKQEWVLKRSWPESDRKGEYVAAPYLRGLFSYLCGRAPKPGEREVESFLRFCRAVDHPEITHAIGLWKNSERAVTH